jgi:hypothetical protein
MEYVEGNRVAALANSATESIAKRDALLRGAPIIEAPKFSLFSIPNVWSI